MRLISTLVSTLVAKTLLDSYDLRQFSNTFGTWGNTNLVPVFYEYTSQTGTRLVQPKFNLKPNQYQCWLQLSQNAAPLVEKKVPFGNMPSKYTRNFLLLLHILRNTQYQDKAGMLDCSYQTNIGTFYIQPRVLMLQNSSDLMWDIYIYTFSVFNLARLQLLHKSKIKDHPTCYIDFNLESIDWIPLISSLKWLNVAQNPNPFFN